MSSEYFDPTGSRAESRTTRRVQEIERVTTRRSVIISDNASSSN